MLGVRKCSYDVLQYEVDVGEWRRTDKFLSIMKPTENIARNLHAFQYSSLGAWWHRFERIP